MNFTHVNYNRFSRYFRSAVLPMSLFLCPYFLKAQEEKTDARHYTSYHLSFGLMATPEVDFSNISANIQFQKENGFGYGIDYTGGYYESPNFTSNPNPSIVMNYDPTTFGPLPRARINGNENDKFHTVSLYLSKGFTSSDRLFFDFQIGPSLVFLKKNEFEYRYIPEVQGTFSGGGSGPLLLADPYSKTKGYFGGYFRAKMQFKASDRTFLELTPFVYVNGGEVLSGIQLGFVFGRGYKKHLFEGD